jgi:hypothetical protein
MTKKADIFDGPMSGVLESKTAFVVAESSLPKRFAKRDLSTARI